MKKEEISIGRFVQVGEKEKERVVNLILKDNDFTVNGESISNIKPVTLTDQVFDSLKFKYYNGWYGAFDDGADAERIAFLKDFDGYIMSIGSYEVKTVKVKYLHELQDIIFSFKKILI